jgi:predicted metal-dependent peptidase
MTKENDDALFKINRAKIFFQRDYPYFSYLSFYLKPIEVKNAGKWKKGGFGMGVDINGNLYYNPEFVNQLTDAECRGVIIHEILHLSLLHLIRDLKLKSHKIANIAQDITINEMIKDNSFVLPKGAIWSNSNREVTIFGKVIKECNNKPFEEIYWEIYEEVKEQIKDAIGRGEKIKLSADGIDFDIDLGEEGYEIEGSNNFGEDNKVWSFDTHIKGENGKELSEDEKQAKAKEWINRTIEASQIAKMVGKEPIGIERIIGDLHKSKVNWRNLLLKYIQSSIPSDYTWENPSKKSISTGIYFPSTLKERIEIFVCVDLSGSIGQEEMNEFLSEIVGIAKTYREKIKFHLWTHETSVNDKYIIENGNVAKILALKLHGGGGTSHQDCISQLQKERDCKVALFFTDGFSDLNTIEFNKNKFDSIFIINKTGSTEQLKDKRVRIIKLD